MTEHGPLDRTLYLYDVHKNIEESLKTKKYSKQRHSLKISNFMSALDRDPVDDLESLSSIGGSYGSYNDNDPGSSSADTGSRSATEEEEEKIETAKRETTLFPCLRLLVFLALLLAAIIVSLTVTVMVMPLTYSIAYALIAGIGVGVLVLFALSIVGIEKLVFHDPDGEDNKKRKASSVK
jgi:hypothetical protein